MGVGLAMDVTNVESIEKASDTIGKRMGANGMLYGLVNNAGILLTPGPVEWQPVESYQKMFSVNVFGIAAVTKVMLPHLRKAKGRIVNVASIAGRVGIPASAAYSSSKYAVE